MKLIRTVTKTGQILHLNPDQIIMLKRIPATGTAWPDYYNVVVPGAEYDLDEEEYYKLVDLLR